LNYGILGPHSEHSQNDVGLIMEWLDAADTSSQNRAFWAIGDGFAESIILDYYQLQIDFLYDYLGTGLTHPNYIKYSGNTEELARYRLLPGWQNKPGGQVHVFGMRNLCTWSNDVLYPWPGTAGTPAAQYERRSQPGTAIATASIFKAWSASSPYKTLVDGWDIEHLTNPSDVNTLDRNGYFYKLFTNVWGKLCAVAGTPIVPLDVPQLGGDGLLDQVLLLNNPMLHRQAGIRLRLAKPDRVEVRIYDVGGRLVRALADRWFATGEHDVVWDGLDDAGAPVRGGVYFSRVKSRSLGVLANRKITVLR
jgi:hypothetical protein